MWNKKKVYLFHSKHSTSFPNTRSSNTFSIRSDTICLKVKDFVKTNLKFILKDNFYLGLLKGSPLSSILRYNSNLTQNQNAFQPTARNVLGNGSANIEFSNELIPFSHRPIEKWTEAYNSKLLLMATKSRSP